jgi:hypothetical protein
MAQGDWTFLLNGASSASVLRGVTNGISRPNGGGNFCYGFNSQDNNQNAVGLPTLGRAEAWRVRRHDRVESLPLRRSARHRRRR